MRILPLLVALATTMNAQIALAQDHQSGVPREFALGISHHEYAAARFENSDVELSMSHTQIKLPFGKLSVGDHILIPSLTFEQTQFDIQNDGALAGDPTVYTLKSQFTFIKKQDDRWMRIIQLTPSLHSDGDVIDEEAFSLMGLAIWQYNATSSSSWNLGFGMNRLFGEYKPVPLLAYQYRPSSNTQIDIGFPITKMEQRFSPSFTAFAQIKPVGGNWRFETVNQEKVNISYSSWIATTGIRYQFMPKFWSTLEIGQSLGRKFILNHEDSAEASIENSSVIMLTIGLHP